MKSETPGAKRDLTYDIDFRIPLQVRSRERIVIHRIVGIATRSVTKT